MKLQQRFLCPVCCEAVGDIRDTTIPYAEARQPNAAMQNYELRLVVCPQCAQQVDAVIAKAHALTRIPFHPLMVQCLRAAKINQEPDVVAWAAAEFADIYRTHHPGN